MIQIRHNTFETNSSSTHSLVMCTKQEYLDFKQGKKFLIDRYYITKQFVTWEELLETVLTHKLIEMDDYDTIVRMKTSGDEEGIEDILRDYEIYTFDSYQDHDYEEFTESYTTPGGEEIVAFGYYG